METYWRINVFGMTGNFCIVPFSEIPHSFDTAGTRENAMF